MPRRCSCFGCRGNYNGTPYVEVISFPKDTQPSFLYTMAITLHDQTKMRFRFHFAELLSFVDAPLAGSKAACTTLANILLKAHVLNVSDKEKSLGCLRRQDKLSN